MEHHTYAKSGSKTWTIEQKRSLVTKCINSDYLFKSPSLRSDRAWKTFKETAQIGDFNENELRQQWQALVHDYRVEKKGISTPINSQIIASLNKKWEFFGEMHKFMMKKNDHHSYAQNAENDQKAQSKIVPQNPKTPKKVVEVSPFDFYPKTVSPNKQERKQDNSKDDEGVKGFVTPTKIYTENDGEVNQDDIPAPSFPGWDGTKLRQPQSTEYNNAENLSDDCAVEVVFPPELYPKPPKKVVEVVPFVPNPKTPTKVPNINTENDGEVNQDDTPTPPELERMQLSQSVENNNQNNSCSVQPKDSKSRKRPAGKELSERDKYYRHRRRYNRSKEKLVKALGQAVIVILREVAQRLGAQTEMQDLEELFASDSEPSPIDSCYDEDSDQD
ncbi:uncharacterized protein LOC108156398 [Drosophila miranda]|uniref:uncharacterized protein LOC108156398 n=1 Tax=Drosophila miranda TaxID=7229 RepID=UPI0007E70FEC|nr:uncharacterized protein LOC108156398 [Drosophila miranda]